MKFIRIIKSVRKLLFINKGRVVLSLVGIAVGIASVIVMYSIGEGAREQLSSDIKKMGANLITVDAGKLTKVIGRKREIGKVTTLKIRDYEAIIEEAEFVNSAAPTQDLTTQAKFEDKQTSVRVIGTNVNYPKIRNYKTKYGRFFNEEENVLSRRVAVVGQKCVQYLFDNNNPIGSYIKINNIRFEVIGTLMPKGMSYDGANEDEVIFIPIKTGMRRLFNVDYIKNIYVQADGKVHITQAETEIRQILREQHRLNIRNKEDDFTIQNVYTTLKAVNKTNESFTSLVIAVSLLSLLVGGIGILAVMILSIKERNFEIGLRIAIGAKPNDIFLQFLIEAIFLSFSGGILGVIIGSLLSIIVSFATELQTILSANIILYSSLFAILIGLIFGVFPAVKAAKLDPIIALNN